MKTSGIHTNNLVSTSRTFPVTGKLLNKWNSNNEILEKEINMLHKICGIKKKKSITFRFQSTTALNSAVSELKFCKTVSVGIFDNLGGETD